MISPTTESNSEGKGVSTNATIAGDLHESSLSTRRKEESKKKKKNMAKNCETKGTKNKKSSSSKGGLSEQPRREYRTVSDDSSEILPISVNPVQV